MRSCSVFRQPVTGSRAVSTHLGWIALCFAAACATDDAALTAESAIEGSALPCQFQEWRRAKNLASNPALVEALAPAQVMHVPGRWLSLSDGSGHFIAIQVDGTTEREAILVILACDGRHVLTAQFGRSAFIGRFPPSEPKDHTPSYVTVQTTRTEPRRERSIVTFYRFYRNRLTEVGQLVNRDVVLEDSVSGTEEVVRSGWSAEQPYLLPHCVLSRRIWRDPTTRLWWPDSSSERTAGEVYRLENDKLRVVSRADSCRPDFVVGGSIPTPQQ